MSDAPYSQWVISTVAGNGAIGLSGDGGPATQAALNNPFDVIFDGAGNLVFTDTFNHSIRRINASNGIIERIAGTGTVGYSGDDGLATEATFNEPYGITIDGDGNLYTADRHNAVVRGSAGSSGSGRPTCPTTGCASSTWQVTQSRPSPALVKPCMTAMTDLLHLLEFLARVRSPATPTTAASTLWNDRAVPSAWWMLQRVRFPLSPARVRPALAVTAVPQRRPSSTGPKK